MTYPTKAGKLPFLRFTKLITTHIMSNNNIINPRSDPKMHRGEMNERYKPAKVTKGGIIHYGLSILDSLLNDMIQEMDAYKEYVENIRGIKGVAEYDDEEPQIPPNSQLLLDVKKTDKLSRREALIQELSRIKGEGFRTSIETHELRDSLDSDQNLSATTLDFVDEGEKDDALNFIVFVHGKQYDLMKKQKKTTTHTNISSPKTK
nr:hypothetical protein [Tanacetum cinerariifolium]